MHTIFYDESGYTGEDLLQKDQATFVIASICIEEDICLEIKNSFFGKIRASELKHSIMQRNKSQQDMIFEFINYIKINHRNDIFFSIVHKKFLLVTKIVDLFIETLMHEDGYDLYDRGGNIALSNLLFISLQSELGRVWFDDFLFRFQNMMRTRTPTSYNNFFEKLELSFPQRIDEFLNMIRIWDVIEGYRGLENIPRDSLNISFAELFTVTHRWSVYLKEHFKIVHDRSSQLAKEKESWSKVMNPHLPEIIVGYDRRKFELPLYVRDLSFEPSKDWAGIQLADILAGAMSRLANWIQKKRPKDNYAENLFRILSYDFETHAIWPSDRVTPDELETTGYNAGEAVEFFSKLLRNG